MLSLQRPGTLSQLEQCHYCSVSFSVEQLQSCGTWLSMTYFSLKIKIKINTHMVLACLTWFSAFPPFVDYTNRLPFLGHVSGNLQMIAVASYKRTGGTLK